MVQLKLANAPQSAAQPSDPAQIRAGFAVEVTKDSEGLVEWVYYLPNGNRTTLARCRADGRVDFPGIGPGWPFVLGGTDGNQIGTRVW